MSALKRLGIKVEDLVQKNYSSNQSQTKDTFGFKWNKTETYDSEHFKANAKRWLIERYCGNDESLIDKWLEGGRKIILDAGCGSAFSALLVFGNRLKSHDYLGVDISDSIEVAKEKFKQLGIQADFLRMSLTDIPVPDNSVDIIYSEGVLHHTDSTETSLKYLAKKIKKGGRFLFYVYAKKAVIREFTDDFIRQYLSNLSDEDAWKALEPLTKLGIELGKLNQEIDIIEDIPYLGIKKGKYDLQRFFYWNICKMYFRPEFTLDEMNHINFDWFRPLNCHRHTPEEIKKWCSEAGLEIERFVVEEAGITVVAKK
jgi:ubiquinone/menaquinone biosynthesis C-methylase UbiE